VHGSLRTPHMPSLDIRDGPYLRLTRGASRHANRGRPPATRRQRDAKAVVRASLVPHAFKGAWVSSHAAHALARHPRRWLYCGFFSLGTLAGELEQPRRTLLISLAILFPTVLVLNTLPIAVALSLDDRPEHYSAGYFNVLAGRLAGSWLDWSFQLGANVCLVGLYNAAVLTAERSLYFLVQSNYAEPMARLAAAQGSSKHRAAPLLRWMLSTSQTGVAPLYILINAACASALVWMPYTILVEFSMLLSVPSILLFMASFVALRVQRPDAERPFRIPGGLAVAIGITVIPIAISLAYAAIVITESFFGHSTARQREHYGDLPPIYQVYSMLGVIALGLIVHGCVRRHGRRRAAMDPLYRGAATDLTQAQLLLSSPDPRGRELSSPHEAGGPSPTRPFAASPVAGRGAASEAGTGRGVGSSLCGRAHCLPREDEAALLGGS